MTDMVVEQMFGHFIYSDKGTPIWSYLFQRGDNNMVPIAFQDDVKYLHTLRPEISDVDLSRFGCIYILKHI
jgi:hypothetical protein